MIRVYGFYSCGGYKDMYLGSSESCNRPSYYLPLLPIMKNRQSPEDLPKIEQQEKLPQIGIITYYNNLGFPQECDWMFSHGGYVAMYRTLSDGSACLALRDIPGSERDEEGRSIPFNLLLIATGAESILELDSVAYSLKDNYVEWRDFATDLFAYDPAVNGTRFDLHVLFDRIKKQAEDSPMQLEHVSNRVIYLMLGSAQNTSLALQEQGLNKSDVQCIVDLFGNLLYGSLPLVAARQPIKEIPEYNEHTPEPEPHTGEEEKTSKNEVFSIPENRAEESQPVEKTLIEEELKELLRKVTEEISILKSENKCNFEALEEQLKQGIGKDIVSKRSLLDFVLPDSLKQYKEDIPVVADVIIILLLLINMAVLAF